jgi:hypothetical protein
MIVMAGTRMNATSFLGGFILVVLFCGCAPSKSVQPVAPPSLHAERTNSVSTSAASAITVAVTNKPQVFCAGTPVSVSLSPNPPATEPEMRLRISEDGKCTRPYGVTVQAAGLTEQELADEIQKA